VNIAAEESGWIASLQHSSNFKTIARGGCERCKFGVTPRAFILAVAVRSVFRQTGRTLAFASRAHDEEIRMKVPGRTHNAASRGAGQDCTMRNCAPARRAYSTAAHADHAQAKALVEKLMRSSNRADLARMTAQARLIEAYERARWPRRAPALRALLTYLLDQHGLSRADLVPLLGTASRVSEVMNGKCELSMIRKLRERSRSRRTC
jgi:HTH-type transcriptional regulator/antitoxin HigA